VLILVRHAEPGYEETVAPALWPLSPAGLAAARALRLPDGARLVASDEVKAWQTLSPHGPVVQDARFREVDREGEPWNGPFLELRRSYVEGAERAGWEPHDAVVRRFDEGIEDFLVRSPERPLVLASHGMAMTVWLHARGCVDRPGEFWAALRFPDVLTVDLATRTVTPAGRE
jgi:broad specificity phosphatase PhoE